MDDAPAKKEKKEVKAAAPASSSAPATVTSGSRPKVAIVIYSMYGHVAKRACS